MFPRFFLPLICVVLAPTPGLIRAAGDPGRLGDGRMSAKGSDLMVASISSPNLAVSKTAFVDGHNVCGVIRLKNTGGQSATIIAIADSLEVHFPRGATPPILPAGSTPGWFKVADVPIPLPGPIAPGTTISIDYCFSLCLTADHAGANSMRNVVTITASIPSGAGRSFTTRSVSFPPPVLDCQACCVPYGTCTDTVSDRCTNTGGLPQGIGTDCASTECLQACCYSDDTCSDVLLTACAGEPKGLGTDCASTQCCIALGDPGCTSFSDCCSNAGGVFCNQGRCCAAARQGCNADADCCDAGAICTNGTCCITAQNGLCFDDSDCCSGVPCVENTCCAPSGLPGSCNADADCCDAGVTCNSGTCCTQLGETGCTSFSDCCSNAGGVFCNQGRCCAAARQGCNADADCCDAGAICTNGTCCITAQNGLCFDDSDCCSGVPCVENTCCAPSGLPGSCNVDADCCDSGVTCNSGTCCTRLGDSGCTDALDCCLNSGGVSCLSGRCCAAAGQECDADTDCCDGNAICSNGACCISLFGSCFADSDCCSGLVCTGGLCDSLIGP